MKELGNLLATLRSPMPTVAMLRLRSAFIAESTPASNGIGQVVKQTQDRVMVRRMLVLLGSRCWPLVRELVWPACRQRGDRPDWGTRPADGRGTTGTAWGPTFKVPYR